jgi:hypothetical protein
LDLTELLVGRGSGDEARRNNRFLFVGGNGCLLRRCISDTVRVDIFFTWWFPTRVTLVVVIFGWNALAWTYTGEKAVFFRG